MADALVVVASLRSAIGLTAGVHLLDYSRTQVLIGVGVFAVLVVTVVIGICRRGRG